ncbi:MAG: HAMP domain-containing histidine kinase [Adlercreutzia sp.]|nr:HAMP domain-containing histidine kinase [Adlercreutzia sp.]
MAAFQGDRRAPLWFLTGLAALLCAAMVIGFYELQADAIGDRAEAAFDQVLYGEAEPQGEALPVVSTFQVAEDASLETLSGLERALVDDYEEYSVQMRKGEIYLLDSRGDYAYFIVFDAAAAQQKGLIGYEVPPDGLLIAYADVSFPIEVVRLTTLVIAGFALFGLIVFVVAQRRVARNFDEDDAAMKSFFANASHELKTPLMAIRGYAEGVKTGVVDVEEGCDVIDRETERMASLVESIMALARVDADAVEPRMARYDVRDVLYEAVDAAAPAASAKGVEIGLDAPDPAVLTCDEDLVFSVFANVLSNAVRHADGEVTVSLRRDGSGVVCEIANDGEPISKEDAAHVFDRFYKGRHGSTGIGMTLAQEYARLHGGSLTVRVANGKTVFRIRLPRGAR